MAADARVDPAPADAPPASAPLPAPPVLTPRPIKLLPIISELSILTKDLRVVRLGEVMNYAQRDFITRCEAQLATTGQIRACVLKARQIGMSTIIEAICFALSILHRDFNSLIVSHEDASAKAILGMTKRYWQTYPFAAMHQEKYNGQNNLAWDNGSDIKVATAKNVGAGRSRTIQFLHSSEVAFWPYPEVLMTGLGQSIPTYGLNCIFVESTANGIGNYFHKTCTEAMKGESEFEFFFYPWHEHPEYTAAYLPPAEQTKFDILNDLDDEEQVLRDRYGISDARLIWRRWAIKNRCQGDLEKFHQEYPTTPHEAFISTGRNVFPLQQLLAHYEPRKGRRGRLIRNGRRIQFVDDPGGWLTVFAEPAPDTDWGVYIAGADPTHTTAGDNACIQILNRRTLEQVAVYRRKIDPINFGKDLQLVGAYYNTAFLAPEKEGPGYATVGCVVADDYPFVYATQNVTKQQGKPVGDVFGWSTNSQTKHLAVASLLKAVTDPLARVGDATYGLVIHDETTLLEMRDYVTTEDGGSYVNSDGSEYDDGVMALAIAVTVNGIEPPPPAYSEDIEIRRPVIAQPGVTGGVVDRDAEKAAARERPVLNADERRLAAEKMAAARGLMAPGRDPNAADPGAPADPASAPDAPDTAPWETWGSNPESW